jgi:hypothetical protein
MDTTLIAVIADDPTQGTGNFFERQGIGAEEQRIFSGNSEALLSRGISPVSAL